MLERPKPPTVAAEKGTQLCFAFFSPLFSVQRRPSKLPKPPDWLRVLRWQAAPGCVTFLELVTDFEASSKRIFPARAPKARGGKKIAFLNAPALGVRENTSGRLYKNLAVSGRTQAASARAVGRPGTGEPENLKDGFAPTLDPGFRRVTDDCSSC